MGGSLRGGPPKAKNLKWCGAQCDLAVFIFFVYSPLYSLAFQNRMFQGMIGRLVCRSQMDFFDSGVFCG